MALIFYTPILHYNGVEHFKTSIEIKIKVSYPIFDSIEAFKTKNKYSLDKKSKCNLYSLWKK